MVGARIFVTTVFVILGATFLATLGALLREFGWEAGSALALFNSHQFVFFPIFGIIALVAFHTPAIVFADVYWHHLPFGRLRFIFGTLVLIGLSLAMSLGPLKSGLGWDISPEVLRKDRGEPPGCAHSAQGCARAPVLDAILDVRDKSQQVVGLSRFSRPCAFNELLEEAPDRNQPRYCFASRTKLDAAACCAAQERFEAFVTKLSADPANYSFTEHVYTLLLPFKVFFLLVMFTIAVMLALLQRTVDRLYTPVVNQLERGVLVGALAMLFWPLTEYAYLQSAAVLFGRDSPGLPLAVSLVTGPWALILLFYFLRRLRESIELIVRLVGLSASAFAVLQFEQIINVAVRVLGSGAKLYMIAAAAALVCATFIPLRFVRSAEPGARSDAPPAAAGSEKRPA
jgi:hypothetical protein